MSNTTGVPPEAPFHAFVSAGATVARRSPGGQQPIAQGSMHSRSACQI
jgi:hypothetical protein